jgi:folate-binding protein YgfZ
MSGRRPAFAVRDPWGLVVVSGPDATSFLQSLVSQDLEPIAVGEGAHSLLLTPQGKLDVLFRITRVADDEWWLDTEPEFGPRLAESLTRFRIRVKAEIDDRTSETGIAAVRGPDAGLRTEMAAEFMPAQSVANAHAGDDELRVVRVVVPGFTGVDVIGPRTRIEALEWPLIEAGVDLLDDATFEAFRIEQGVPRLGVDVDEKTIPQEAFLEVDAVSFTKGCFLGQELVTRIDTRGHVNKYLRRLAVEGDLVPPRGASIESDGKDVGTVTSSAAVPDDGRVVALGMIRREVEPPAGVALRWDGGHANAEVLASPTVA